MFTRSRSPGARIADPVAAGQRAGQRNDRNMRRGLRYSRSMPGDEAPIRIVDTAIAEAARKSGAWLVCRPGRTGCRMGPFPITQLDARSPREGLAELESRGQTMVAFALVTAP